MVGQANSKPWRIRQDSRMIVLPARWNIGLQSLCQAAVADDAA